MKRKVFIRCLVAATVLSAAALVLFRFGFFDAGTGDGVDSHEAASAQTKNVSTVIRYAK